MSLITRSIEIFKILFKRKIIKIGILINAGYLIAGIIFFFISPTGNDFSVYYQAGYLSVTNLKLLYNTIEYTLPFRYLPISALLYSILTIFHPYTSYIIFSLLSFAINIPIIIMIYYIIFDILMINKKYESFTIKLIFGYLIYLPHLDNYINGQINLFLLFFLLCSYCFFLVQIYTIKNKNYSKFYISNLLGGIFLGLAILIKITAAVILPFILILGSYQTIYNGKKKSSENPNKINNHTPNKPKFKNNTDNINITDSSSELKTSDNLYYSNNTDNPISSNNSSYSSDYSTDTPQKQRKINIGFLVKINILRFSGTIIILILSIIFFIIRPDLLNGFMSVNFSGNAEQVKNHSISITRQVLNLFLILRISVPNLLIMLAIFVPILAINLYISFKKGMHEYYLSFYYSLALFTLYLGYYDTWVHHLIVICPFIIISLITIRSYIENKGSFQNSNQNSITTSEINPSKFNMKDYNYTLYLFILMGGYLWLLLYFLTQNLFYNGAPGLNFIYPIIILLLYIKIIKFLMKSS